MSPLPLTILGWMAAAFAATIIGMSKAGFGTGAGIFAVPLLTLATGSAQHMLAVMLPVLICGDVFSIIHYRGKKNWRLLSMLIGGCIIGVGAAWAILHSLGDLNELSIGNGSITGDILLEKIVGGICTLFVTAQMWRFWKDKRKLNGKGKDTPYTPKPIHGIGVGTAAGLTSTLSHSAGPIINLFMLPQKLNKSVFVGTVVTYFLFGNMIKLIPFTIEKMFTPQRLVTAFILFPFAAGGTLLGLYLNKRIKSEHFMWGLYAITFFLGLKLLF